LEIGALFSFLYSKLLLWIISVKVLKVADIGTYTFSESDFEGLPYGTKFKINILRGNFATALDNENHQHLVTAFSTASGIFKYTKKL
jgi:hypothetical protein